MCTDTLFVFDAIRTTFLAVTSAFLTAGKECRVFQKHACLKTMLVQRPGTVCMLVPRGTGDEYFQKHCGTKRDRNPRAYCVFQKPWTARRYSPNNFPKIVQIVQKHCGNKEDRKTEAWCVFQKLRSGGRKTVRDREIVWNLLVRTVDSRGERWKRFPKIFWTEQWVSTTVVGEVARNFVLWIRWHRSIYGLKWRPLDSVFNFGNENT